MNYLLRNLKLILLGIAASLIINVIFTEVTAKRPALQGPLTHMVQDGLCASHPLNDPSFDCLPGDRQLEAGFPFKSSVITSQKNTSVLPAMSKTGTFYVNWLCWSAVVTIGLMLAGKKYAHPRY